MAPKGEDIRMRLRRVEGQVRGLQRMLDEKRSCEEIMTQLCAARNALDKTAAELFVLQAKECMADENGSRASFETLVRLFAKLGH